MTEDRKKDEKLFYYPLIKKDNRYVEGLESTLMGLDIPSLSEFKGYIDRHYHRTKSEIELAGKTYFTDIYVPNDNDDFSYVLADSDGIPQGIEEKESVSYQYLDEYIQYLSKEISFAEGISPDQASYLKTEFMIPSFKDVDSTAPEKKYSWEDIKLKSRLVIVGDPGSGKTTCLRKLALEVATKSPAALKQTIPVYIQLRYCHENTNIIDNMRQQLSRLSADYLALNLVDLLESGRLIVMLDGLDELPASAQKKVRNSILDIAEKFPRLGLIVATRKAGYQWYLPGFHHLEINPFSESAIKEWTCQRLYGDKEKSWNIFVSHLRGQSEIFQLIKNPLMLTIAVYLYKRSSFVPQNRATLVSKFVEAVVDLWDVVRGVTRNTEIWASPTYKLSSLCRAAYSLKQTEKNCFSTKDFIDWEKEYLDEKNTENMLAVLVKHTGLLQKVESDDSEQWCFKHDMITDYLAARYIIERTDDNGIFLREQLSHKKWQDIWILACGTAQDSTHLVKIVLENEHLDEFTKGTLLARAFSQNFAIDHKVIEASSNYIVSSLETLMESFEGLTPKEEKEREAILWQASYREKANRSNLNLHLCEQLKQLLFAIYNARSGTAYKILRNILSASRTREIASFVQCLDFDGRYVTKIDTTDDYAIVSIRIYPEIPDLNASLNSDRKGYATP